MVDSVSETRIEQQTTMMNKGFKTLILGSMYTMNIKKALTVATMIAAMAVPAMAVSLSSGETVTWTSADDNGFTQDTVEFEDVGDIHVTINGGAFIRVGALKVEGDSGASTLDISNGTLSLNQLVGGKDFPMTTTIGDGGALRIDSAGTTYDTWAQWTIEDAGSSVNLSGTGELVFQTSITSVAPGEEAKILGLGGANRFDGGVSKATAGEYTTYTAATVPLPFSYDVYNLTSDSDVITGTITFDTSQAPNSTGGGIDTYIASFGDGLTSWNPAIVDFEIFVSGGTIGPFDRSGDKMVMTLTMASSSHATLAEDTPLTLNMDSDQVDIGPYLYTVTTIDFATGNGEINNPIHAAITGAALTSAGGATPLPGTVIMFR